MMNTVKALLIDPEKKSVSEVVLQSKKGCYLNSMYKLIGCNCVTVVYNAIPGVTDDIWLDDEGFFNNPEFFFIPPAPEYQESNYWLAGKALILGHDEEGDLTSHTIHQDQIGKLVESITFGMSINR
jgi:hypothetical protein